MIICHTLYLDKIVEAHDDPHEQRATDRADVTCDATGRQEYSRPDDITHGNGDGIEECDMTSLSASQIKVDFVRCSSASSLKGHCIEFKYYADGIHSGLTPPS